MTNEQKRVLEIVNNEGFACAGKYYPSAVCRGKDISASTLRSLAYRGLVTLYSHQDGGIAARKVETKALLVISPLQHGV